MADLKTLSGEITKLKKQIETVLYISKYYDYYALSGLDDFHKPKTADEWQQMEEYCNILDKLDGIQASLAYYEKPVKEVSRLHINQNGRYETDKGALLHKWQLYRIYAY